MRRRKADNSGNARSEQLLVVPSAYRVTSQQRMAARRALEWIRALKPAWFLDMKYHTCFQEYLLFIIHVLLETRSWNDSPPMGTAVFTLKFMP